MEQHKDNKSLANFIIDDTLQAVRHSEQEMESIRKAERSQIKRSVILFAIVLFIASVAFALVITG